MAYKLVKLDDARPFFAEVDPNTRDQLQRDESDAVATFTSPIDVADNEGRIEVKKAAEELQAATLRLEEENFKLQDARQLYAALKQRYEKLAEDIQRIEQELEADNDGQGIFGMMAGGRPRLLTDEDIKKRDHDNRRKRADARRGKLEEAEKFKDDDVNLSQIVRVGVLEQFFRALRELRDRVVTFLDLLENDVSLLKSRFGPQLVVGFDCRRQLVQSLLYPLLIIWLPITAVMVIRGDLKNEFETRLDTVAPLWKPSLHAASAAALSFVGMALSVLSVLFSVSFGLLESFAEWHRMDLFKLEDDQTKAKFSVVVFEFGCCELLNGRQALEIVNAQELITSKLKGLADDSNEELRAEADPAPSDAATTSAASPRLVQRVRNSTSFRILGLFFHVVAAAAAAFAVPYSLWYAALATPNGFGSSSVVLVLQPLLQVLLLRVTAHVSWLFARYESWSSPKQLHVVMAARHMFAQLCVYGSVLAQAYATVSGTTSFPTFQVRYYLQNGAVVAAGYAEGDCMCLDYCLSAIVLFLVFDVAIEMLYICAVVGVWVVTSVKTTIPCHLSTSSLPLRTMLLITLLGIHPIACFMMVVLIIVAMKALRFACVVIYKPAVHLPHPAVERLLQNALLLISVIVAVLPIYARFVLHSVASHDSAACKSITAACTASPASSSYEILASKVTVWSGLTAAAAQTSALAAAAAAIAASAYTSWAAAAVAVAALYISRGEYMVVEKYCDDLVYNMLQRIDMLQRQIDKQNKILAVS